MGSKKTKAYFVVAAALFLCSCATPGAPTGGVRDTTPPKVRSQSPAQNASNVKQTKLEASFDEFIQVKNPAQGVLISPPPSTPPDIKVKKEVLTIHFKDSLLNNTTYSIQFGDNLQDVNESNPVSNFTWVFSTGDHIDSLALSGTIGLSGINEMPENTWVLLYKNLHDSAFLSERPYYFSKVEKSSGAFRFNNLKEGTYRMFALEDRNGNYYYDLPIEKIGFSDSVLDLQNNLQVNHISLFDPEPDEQYLVDYSTSLKNNSWQARLAKPAQEWKVTSITDSVYSRSIMLEDRQTIQTWVRAGPGLTTAGWEIIADSMTDTVYVSVVAQAPQRTSIIRGTTQVPSEAVPGGTLTAVIGDSVSLFQEMPVVSVVDTNISLIDTSGNSMAFTASIDEDSMSIKLSADLQPGSFDLKFLPGAIKFFTGENQDTIRYRLSMISSELAGSLVLNLEFPSDNQYVITILNEQGLRMAHSVVVPDNRSFAIRLDKIVPGRYTVQAINDKDNNGVLTRGSYFEKRLPEERFVSSPVELKAGWEQESTIKIIFD